ncbi:barstar family protein [Rheinheimera tangshanensis]|uniref:Barstar family protein n=1 Tax=Rheinheimera tangshanensis TaxID=400153 RepID=A0A5C8M4B4_9GAMM|nr:barstar family protein [Rheinheimera tangshanensis]TXK83193.1 barstar family protein [Rheinheimera tangshanensis]GGM45550.1 barnase inhibitor [Rheinheimera tangshanensis]
MIRIDANKIIDWNSFHGVFSEVFGFPDFYGANMNAWIDCLSDLDDPDSGMTKMHIEPGETLTVLIENSREFKERCPEQFSALVECAAFVNYRCTEKNQPALIALAFSV